MTFSDLQPCPDRIITFLIRDVRNSKSRHASVMYGKCPRLLRLRRDDDTRD